MIDDDDDGDVGGHSDYVMNAQEYGEGQGRTSAAVGDTGWALEQGGANSRHCSLHHGNRVLFVPLGVRSCTDQRDALHAAQLINVLGGTSDLLSLEVLDLERSSNWPRLWWKV